jgi:hypothetical protein
MRRPWLGVQEFQERGVLAQVADQRVVVCSGSIQFSTFRWGIMDAVVGMSSIGSL